jgi:hypothetical protein
MKEKEFPTMHPAGHGLFVYEAEPTLRIHHISVFVEAVNFFCMLVSWSWLNVNNQRRDFMC